MPHITPAGFFTDGVKDLVFLFGGREFPGGFRGWADKAVWGLVSQKGQACAEKTNMTLNPAWYVLAIAGVLTYFVVTTIMRVLAAHYYREKSLHELIRQAKQAKLDYYHELAIRQGLIPDDSGGIEIEDSELSDEDVEAVADAPAPAGKIGPEETPAKQAA